MQDRMEAQIRAYFAALTAGDMDRVIALFADDGAVVSPFLGTLPARAFFEKLGKASAQSSLTVHDVLIGTAGETGAAHFRYDWTLADGSKISFEGVDHFTFAPDLRFRMMRIYYDTHPLRQEVGDKYANA